jgi:hypothetical protein
MNVGDEAAVLHRWRVLRFVPASRSGSLRENTRMGSVKR